MNALCAKVLPLLDHFRHRKRHWTILFAKMAGYAFFLLCYDLQAGQMQEAGDFDAKDHKRGHPAKIMAEDAFTEQDGGDENQYDHSIVYNIIPDL